MSTATLTQSQIDSILDDLAQNMGAEIIRDARVAQYTLPCVWVGLTGVRVIDEAGPGSGFDFSAVDCLARKIDVDVRIVRPSDPSRLVPDVIGNGGAALAPHRQDQIVAALRSGIP